MLCLALTLAMLAALGMSGAGGGASDDSDFNVPAFAMDGRYDLDKALIVVASGGSGSRSIALLLDKMGVFMATGEPGGEILLLRW